jgi:hypothetical protein
MYIGKVLLTGILIGVVIIAFYQETKWDGHKNGRRYYLNHTCIQSHFETGTRTQLVGKVWTTLPFKYEVCDNYKVDTIWEN